MITTEELEDFCGIGGACQSRWTRIVEDGYKMNDLRFAHPRTRSAVHLDGQLKYGPRAKGARLSAAGCIQLRCATVEGLSFDWSECFDQGLGQPGLYLAPAFLYDAVRVGEASPWAIVQRLY
jgi:hypothetical protein